MKTLIVSAAKFEVLPLLKELEKKSFPFTYFEIGIGPLNAAQKSSELEALCEGTHTFYLGTCGTFGPFEKPYLVQASKTYWMPAGIRTGISDFENSWAPPIQFKNYSKEIDLPKKIILTSPEISITKEIKRKELVEASSEYCENMELYPVASALEKASKLNIILGVTNAIGPSARNEWKQNFRLASQITKDFFLQTYLT